jgi:hypothetical protein
VSAIEFREVETQLPMRRVNGVDPGAFGPFQIALEVCGVSPNSVRRSTPLNLEMSQETVDEL